MKENSVGKRRLISVFQTLWRLSDNEHHLSLSDINKELKQHGIEASSRTIQDDIEIMNFMGLDIGCEVVQNGAKKYWICSRLFEDAEIKMLVDMVKFSAFLSDYRKEEIVKKLKYFTSVYSATMMTRKVFSTVDVSESDISNNENVEKLYTAIFYKNMVDFFYMKYDCNRKLVKKKAERYLISPISLMWNNRHYYLIGFCHTEFKIKYFRVDKIEDVRFLEKIPKEILYMNIDKIESDAKRSIGMFMGPEKIVELKCANNLIGTIIDQFGMDYFYRSLDDGTFEAHVKASFSHTFIGWVIGLKDAQIIGPPELVETIKVYLKNQLEKYE